jgi:hypothetical protein
MIKEADREFLVISGFKILKHKDLINNFKKIVLKKYMIKNKSTKKDRKSFNKSYVYLYIGTKV